MPRTITVRDATGHWAARTATGRDEWTSVVTTWSTTEEAWITRVERFDDGCTIPLEYRRSVTERQARRTHNGSVKRHPINGRAKTLPRKYMKDRCTRCGEPRESSHTPRCREDQSEQLPLHHGTGEPPF